MRITRISRLRGCGIFRDFSWPKDLPELGRYNLIYGWNWTGKTTLSRIFRSLELCQQPSVGQVVLCINGRDIGNEEFLESTIQIRVFNRDFIEESVFRKDGGDLPPIFVFGKESVEIQKEVEKLQTELASAKSNLDDVRSQKDRAEKEFERFCIEKARVIKNALRSPGVNKYNNYDKAAFRSDAENMARAGNSATHRLSDEEHEKLLVQHRAMQKTKLKEITYSLPELEAIADQVSSLLKTSVVSSAIEALKHDPELAEWSRSGLILHLKRNAERCLFCEQPLPKERLATLEAHFSAQYEQFMEKLDDWINRLNGLSNEAAELQLPHKAELYEDLKPEYEIAQTGLRKTLEAAESFFKAIVQALTDKKRRPFDPADLKLEVPDVDNEALKKLNAVIRKHNQACDEFQTRVDAARERLALDMIANELDEFLRLRNTVEQAATHADEAEKEVQCLKEKINRLEQQIVEHRRPAAELNEDLRKYLGHDELRLEIKETGYTITRGREQARTLSEGEMTAISLLYFLKSLQDRRFDLANSVVVLDDPVSSLDANALYFAFGLIREFTQNAGQLIILTHNFAFFRQVRNWFHYLKGQKKKDISQRPARFYMLECVRDQNGRCATIRTLDPLLEEYDSEYHYLFARIYRAASEDRPLYLEQNYELPNMARRLIETFLAFRQPQMAGELWQKMKELEFDEAKKIRILRFVHTHSHSSALEEPEHDLSVLAEGPAVIKDLLELIKSMDPKHYSAMIEIVNKHREAGDGEDEVVM